MLHTLSNLTVGLLLVTLIVGIILASISMPEEGGVVVIFGLGTMLFSNVFARILK